MASNQLMNFCRQCKQNTLHIQPATSHVLHLLLSIITMGVWIFVWVLVAMSNGSQRNCTVCGRARGLFGT